MENKKKKEPWYKFSFALVKLRAYLPGPWAVDPPIPPKDREMYYSLARAFEGLDVWIGDLEKRLEFLEDVFLEVGWDRIAAKVGVSKRTVQRPRHKKKLLQDGIIQYRHRGHPPRLRPVGVSSRLEQYGNMLKKKHKT